MKKQFVTVLVVYLFAFALALNGKAQDNAPLKLVQKIPMSGVQGRMDHITVDVKGKRLFVPANGDNQNTVEVIDLQAGKRIASIPGQSKPQGTFYSGDFKTDARPGGITFEKSGPRIFVNLNGATKLGVLDRKKREQITTWPVAGAENYGPLALDESHHRLFLGTRKPPTLIVFDTESGKQITQLDSVPSIDGVWYDAMRKRIYITGNGFIAVYDQKGADDYTPMVKVATEADSQPSIWVPQFNRLYFSVPQAGRNTAD